MSTSMLEVADLHKGFGDKGSVLALRGLNLEVKQGEFLVLLGPSGCGKTTLLRCIAGLERADRGVITIGGSVAVDAQNGVDQPPNKRDIGMVFQNYVLWPHMTVLGNVVFAARARGGLSKAAAKAAAMDQLRVVQCDMLAGRYPHELSGGQQQRVALARGLVGGPSVLLLDEPLSNLDAMLRIELRRQLRAIHERLGFTGIYVTHDLTEALNLGTRVAVMREGAIEQLSTPEELYHFPATEYVATFMGMSNRLPISKQGSDWWCDFGCLRGAEALGHRLGEGTCLYLKPDRLRVELASEANGRETAGELVLGHGRVSVALFSGNNREYRVAAGASEIDVSCSADGPALGAGDEVVIKASSSDVLVYRDGALVR